MQDEQEIAETVEIVAEAIEADDDKPKVKKAADAVSSARKAVAKAVNTARSTIVDTVKGEPGTVLAPKTATGEDEAPLVEISGYLVPSPVTNDREYEALDALTERYEKLIKPGLVKKVGSKVSSIVPQGAKDLATDVKRQLTEQELYMNAMKIVADGFKVVEERAARITVDERGVIEGINKLVAYRDINSLEEVCLIRSYDIERLVDTFKTQHLVLAFAQGGATGFPGLPGIPFNLVLSTFLYYRAVQSVAMYYGYDVKNNPDELVIAGEVFARAMDPSSDSLGGVGDTISKIMTIATAEGVKHAAKKGWKQMAMSGGPALLLTQMRALAHRSAQKALENAGQKSLENSVFKEIFEQIGKRLSLKSIQRSVPYISAGIGALFDTAQMNKVVDFANVFYSKRFILEKEARVSSLTGQVASEESAVEVDYEPIEEDEDASE